MKTIVRFSMAALLVALPPTRLTATTDAVRGEIQAQSHAFTEALARGDAAAAAQAAPASSEAQSAGVRASGSVAMPMPDRVGFPADYRRAFKLLGAGGGEKDALVHTAFANAAAAGVFEGTPLPFPNGAVIAMEFANPLKDGEGQVLRDEQGVPMPGEVVRIDVMRRGAGYGAHYGDKRAGEWEFASYTPTGAAVMPPANGASCADCHRNAGADNDFVFRMRAKPGAP